MGKDGARASTQAKVDFVNPCTEHGTSRAHSGAHTINIAGTGPAQEKVGRGSRDTGGKDGESCDQEELHLMEV